MTELAGLSTATLVAGALAALVGITVVMPAELGVDPLGSGRWLGITRGVDPSVHVVMSQDLVADDVKFTLDPYESIEYKYRIQEGRSIVYTWEASDEVVFEFHGELEGQPEGEAETYQLGRAEGASGRFSAPANGVHGWYWQNRSFSAVTVSLTAVGFIDGALTFSRVGVQERNIGSTEE